MLSDQIALILEKLEDTSAKKHIDHRILATEMESRKVSLTENSLELFLRKVIDCAELIWNTRPDALHPDRSMTPSIRPTFNKLDYDREVGESVYQLLVELVGELDSSKPTNAQGTPIQITTANALIYECAYNTLARGGALL